MVEDDKGNNEDYIEMNNGIIKYGCNYITEAHSASQFEVHIPSFDISFSVTKEDQIEKRVKAATASFFNFWIDNQGWNNFLHEINRLGYRTFDHHYKMKKLARRKELNVIFRNKKEMEYLKNSSIKVSTVQYTL